MASNGEVPNVPENTAAIINTLIDVVHSGKLTASHDLSLGGLAAALCEMCEGIGAEVDLSTVADDLRADDLLFSESYTRAIITSSEPESVKEMLKEIPYTVIGTTGGDKLSIKGKELDITLSIDEINEARNSLMHLMME